MVANVPADGAKRAPFEPGSRLALKILAPALVLFGTLDYFLPRSM